MTSDYLFSWVLSAHIFAGSVALLTLAVPFVATKGSLVHRRVGWVFSAAMVTVGLSAWVLAGLRLLDADAGNDSAALFLGQVGLFSTSSVWMGLRSLRLRRGRAKFGPGLDKAVAVILLGASFGLVIYGITQSEILMIVFGALGLTSGASMLRFLLRDLSDSKAALVMHLSAMGNGAISAVTAFFVVNVPRFGLNDYALYFWIGPGLLGGALISWWAVGLRRGRVALVTKMQAQSSALDTRRPDE